MPKRSALKWTNDEMGHPKKGENKTGCAKVIMPKRRASICGFLTIDKIHWTLVC